MHFFIKSNAPKAPKIISLNKVTGISQIKCEAIRPYLRQELCFLRLTNVKNNVQLLRLAKVLDWGTRSPEKVLETHTKKRILLLSKTNFRQVVA